MENRICGPCARKIDLDLMKRHELASGRIPGVKYLCLICQSIHSLPIVPGVKGKKEDIEQIKLF